MQTIANELKQIFGSDTSILRSERVFGGDINEAYRLTLQDGMQVFLKTNKKENASFFSTEAAGLRAIAATNTIGTPKVLAQGIDEQKSCAYLLLEFISGGKTVTDHWAVFASELAALHQSGTRELVPGGRYGFYQNNYIGAGRQKNEARDSWITFFGECRLKPQYQRAAHYFDRAQQNAFLSLFEHLADFLVEPEHPSLLHGDLWSGNVITGNDGKLWLIDPAVSVGHAEADLAMTELFGGFHQRFYEAYQAEAPLQPGYEKRRDLYNLYHMLNHLNLFGRSYLPSVLRILKEYSP